MEENRYKLESYNEAFCEIHDTKKDEWYIRKDLITDLLNQQDKRIKELKEQIKTKDTILEEYKKCNCKECMTDYEKNLNQIIDKYLYENNSLKQENNQLKQSQKQLAIIELEKTKICCEKYAEELYDNLVDVVVPTDIDKPKREAIKYLYLVSEVIDDRIKSLKGEIPTIKCSLCGREMVKLADGVNYCCNYCHTQTLLNVLDIGEE